MKGDPLPEQDHISRYCFAIHCTENGKVTWTAFQLRQIDDYLSVNWMEYLRLDHRQEEIGEIRKILSSKLTLGAKAKIAVVEADLAERDETSFSANEKNHDEAMKGMRFLANKVALLLNPIETDHSELISLLKRLEDHCINGDPSDRKIEGELQDSITSTGQRILKREWERVKRGK